MPRCVQPTVTVPRGGQAESAVRVYVPEARPRGIVHFIGGAVVGAAPRLTYKHLLERMARGGFTVVQTSYPFTFQHQACAEALHEVHISASLHCCFAT